MLLEEGALEKEEEQEVGGKRQEEGILALQDSEEPERRTGVGSKMRDRYLSQVEESIRR